MKVWVWMIWNNKNNSNYDDSSKSCLGSTILGHDRKVKNHSSIWMNVVKMKDALWFDSTDFKDVGVS